MLRSLKRGEIIRHPARPKREALRSNLGSVLRELAATPSGFDRLAMMAGAPVVPVFIVRQPDGVSHVIEIFEEIPQQRTGDRNADALVEHRLVTKKAIRRDGPKTPRNRSDAPPLPHHAQVE